MASYYLRDIGIQTKALKQQLGISFRLNSSILLGIDTGLDRQFISNKSAASYIRFLNCIKMAVFIHVSYHALRTHACINRPIKILITITWLLTNRKEKLELLRTGEFEKIRSVGRAG